jgi:hypothetical protein
MLIEDLTPGGLAKVLTPSQTQHNFSSRIYQPLVWC